MKAIQSILIGVLVLIISVTIGLFIVLTSSFDIGPIEQTNYSAILMSRSELEKSIEYQSARIVEVPGKIYKKDNLIFITEKYKGIHIIDNTNPANPIKTGFIRVPGCIDIAVKNNSLYADNSVDLVTIDIGSLPGIKVTERVKNIFPELTPPDLRFIPGKYSQYNRPANTVIVEWKKIK